MATSTNKVDLDFHVQHQLKVSWCWSAVGTSCALFYDKTSGWTQCKMASQAIQPPPGNCCGTTELPACDVTWFLVNPDQTEGALIVAGIAQGFKVGAIPFEQLKAELDGGRPVAFRLKLDYHGIPMFHFVTIAGYEMNEAGDQYVTIYDYFFGNAVMQYKDFMTNYKYNGSVTHTFPTVSNKKT